MNADDVVLIGEWMEEAYDAREKALEEKGLKINLGKTKGMRVSSRSEGLWEVAL